MEKKVTCKNSVKELSFEWSHYGAVNPPRLQILRIDRDGLIDDVITHAT